MPFEQLPIFLIISISLQAPDIELKAMDCVFPCCTGRILQYAQSWTGQTSSYITAPAHIADKPTAPIHILAPKSGLKVAFFKYNLAYFSGKNLATLA
jgi:hypothetical protein